MQPDTGINDGGYYVVTAIMSFQSLVGPCGACGTVMPCEPMKGEASIGFFPVFDRYEDARAFVDGMTVKGAQIMHMERNR